MNVTILQLIKEQLSFHILYSYDNLSDSTKCKSIQAQNTFIKGLEVWDESNKTCHVWIRKLTYN